MNFLAHSLLFPSRGRNGAANPPPRLNMRLQNSASQTQREISAIASWPASLHNSARQASIIARSYLDAIVEDDISEVDNIDRDPVRVRRLLASLGRNEATLASKATALRDTAEYADVDKPYDRPSPLAESTFNEYIGALERMYFIDDVPAWHPALRSPVRIRTAHKHHLADPSLAAAAIGATVDTLLADPKTLGLLFESLATHDLTVYARSMDATVMHYRDDSNLEVDLIVEAHNDGVQVIPLDTLGM